MAIVCKCLTCGKEFTRFPRDIKRGGGKYCSRLCLNESRRRSGTRTQMPDGYIRIQLGYGRTKAEHRYVMEKYLGRELVETELVHHIDGNKSNNHISNLQVVTAKEHAKIHLTLKNQWAKNHNQCIECGTTEREHIANGLCFRCHNRRYARLWRQSR